MTTITTYNDSNQAQPSSSTSTPVTSTPTDSIAGGTTTNPNTSTGSAAAATQGDNDDAGKKKKTTKRRKVNHACLYCRRSHMTCDEGRPCQRWWVFNDDDFLFTSAQERFCDSIKREIGHLCHDERRPKPADKATPTPTPAPSVGMAGTYAPGIMNCVIKVKQLLIWVILVPVYQGQPQTAPNAWPMQVPQSNFLYQPETLGNEFSVLTYVQYIYITMCTSSYSVVIFSKPLTKVLSSPHQQLWHLPSCRQQLMHPMAQPPPQRPLPPRQRTRHQPSPIPPPVPSPTPPSPRPQPLPISTPWPAWKGHPQKPFSHPQPRLKNFCSPPPTKSLVPGMNVSIGSSELNTRQDSWNRTIMSRVMLAYRGGWIASEYMSVICYLWHL